MIDIKIALEFSIDLAKRAGRLQKERYEDGERDIEHKGVINIVTDVDMECEKLITAAIMERYPDHGIIAEEGTAANSGAMYQWIIDPLDGTTNYAHGFPMFAPSIALTSGGEPLVGAVFDPMRDELFSGIRGGGSYLNGNRIKVSGTKDMDDALLGTGFPYDMRTNEENNLKNFNRVALNCQAIRRAGSAALDLCYVACGRFDGFWEQRLYSWDMAAGVLFIREAGGVVTDMKGGTDGKPFDLNGETIAAANVHIHPRLIDLLLLK